jgi:hypothetical protein
MMRYEILDDQGNVTNTIIAEPVFVAEHYSNYRQVEEPEATGSANRILSKYAFSQRFTPQERIAIRQAAQMDVEVADYYELAQIADEVNLDELTTAQGLDLLISKGLLAAERKAEILA